MSLPSIFRATEGNTHRVLRVPSFEVDLILDDALLDCNVLDRVAVVLDVEIRTGRPDYKVRQAEDKAFPDRPARPYLDAVRVLYEGQVVDGSQVLTAYARGPEQLALAAEDVA